jgi:hypothetical protein
MVARLGLRSHTITIERNRGGKWSELSAGGSVTPEEGIRYSAHFGWQWSTAKAEFTLKDSQGNTVWGPRSANANPAGNAWIDVNAPILPGTYMLNVKGMESKPGSFGLWTSSHDSTRSYRVSKSAPSIPGGGQLPGLPGLGDIGGIFTSPWTFVLLLVGLIALGILL